LSGFAKGCPTGPVEEVPCNDEIERRIGWAEAATVKNSDQTFPLYQEVCRDEVLMAHYLGTCRRQFAQDSPEVPETRDVEKVFTFGEADLHPIVMI